MKRVYLAGAIENQTSEYANAWRRRAASAVGAYDNLDVIDPTFYDGASEGLSASEVVIRDTYLLQQADAVLADGRKPGWGTAMEILKAYQLGKLVVVWGAERRSLFLQHHTAKFVDTPEEGMVYIMSLLELAE